MDNIKWEDGAVCFARDTYWHASSDLPNSGMSAFLHALEFKDFQLNEIRQGDYIEASELDTEQKYNDAVDVFGLFGFARGGDFALCYGDFVSHPNEDSLICYDELVMSTASSHKQCKRKITYSQLMAIGKLKRAMIERDNVDYYEHNNVDGTLKNNMRPPSHAELKSSDFESSDAGVLSEWSDEHYNHFYQLTEDDIKAGQIKVDAYFVNRMWKINSWEDTGAGFHILKTFPRIANNKNSLKRELVALKKQVDILCKLHGVDDDTN